jgi:hypothetical protein
MIYRQRRHLWSLLLRVLYLSLDKYKHRPPQIWTSQPHIAAMSESWPPPPNVQDDHEMTCVPDSYDEMSGLEQATAAQTEAAATTAPSLAPQNSADTSGAPTLTLPAHWGAIPEGFPIVLLTDMLNSVGVTQDVLNTVAPLPLWMMEGALDAAGPPPGIAASANLEHPPALLSTPAMSIFGFAEAFTGLSGFPDAQQGEDSWEDVPEDGDEDAEDDMPSLDNPVPNVTVPPVAFQASVMANVAELMAATAGPFGAPFPGEFYGPLNQPNPTADPHVVDPTMPGVSPDAQDGLVDVNGAPATNPGNYDSQDEPDGAQPAAVDGPQVNFNFMVGSLPPPSAADMDSYIANFPQQLAAALTAASAGATDPANGALDLDGASNIHVGSFAVPTAALPEFLAAMPFDTDPLQIIPISPGGLPPSISLSSIFRPPRPSFDTAAFVDTLDRVDITNIPAEDMRCPHCWLPFGTTDEDDPAFVFTPDPDDPLEVAARQTAFRELLLDAGRADNDRVRTPCGHLFGRGCLIETMEKVDTLCPTCRQELRPAPEIPSMMD